MHRFTDVSIVREKLQQAFAMLRACEVDAWFIIDTEGRDPSLSLLAGGATSGRTVYILTRQGHISAITGWPDKGHLESLEVFDEVIARPGEDMGSVFYRQYERISPGSFLLNYSASDSLCDGLSHGSFLWLQRLIGKKEMRRRARSSQSILSELRSIKSEEELRRVRTAIDHNLQIYAEVGEKIESGMTEKQIRGLFRAAIDRRTARGVMAQDGPLVLLPKAGMAHREPTEAALAPGDLLVIDFGLGYRGYHSDIARTFYCRREGEDREPDHIARAFSAIRGAIDRAFAAMRPGAYGADIDGIARRHLLDCGYPEIKHSLGHQIGQAVHDGGTSLRPPRGDETREDVGRLREGELYTLEPTILEGELSFISEENVRVTGSEAEKLHPWQERLWYIDP